MERANCWSGLVVVTYCNLADYLNMSRRYAEDCGSRVGNKIIQIAVAITRYKEINIGSINRVSCGGAVRERRQGCLPALAAAAEGEGACQPDGTLAFGGRAREMMFLFKWANRLDSNRSLKWENNRERPERKRERERCVRCRGEEETRRVSMEVAQVDGGPRRTDTPSRYIAVAVAYFLLTYGDATDTNMFTTLVYIGTVPPPVYALIPHLHYTSTPLLLDH